MVRGVIIGSSLYEQSCYGEKEERVVFFSHHIPTVSAERLSRATIGPKGTAAKSRTMLFMGDSGMEWVSAVRIDDSICV